MGLALKPKELIKFLESIGYEFERQKGTSHRIYKKDDITIPVPMHNKDIPLGTLAVILKEAGTTKKELEKWMGR